MGTVGEANPCWSFPPFGAAFDQPRMFGSHSGRLAEPHEHQVVTDPALGGMPQQSHCAPIPPLLDADFLLALDALTNRSSAIPHPCAAHRPREE